MTSGDPWENPSRPWSPPAPPSSPPPSYSAPWPPPSSATWPPPSSATWPPPSSATWPPPPSATWPPTTTPTPRPWPSAPPPWPPAQAPAGWPPPAPGWPPPPPAWALPPPPRRIRWGRWILGTIATLLVCCVGGAGALVGYAGSTGALDQRSEWLAGQGNSQQPPAADASVTDWRLWVFKATGEILETRAKAINAGDQKAFLAPVDPANARFVTEQTRRFQVLRRMEVGIYREVVTGTPTDVGQRRWRLETDMFYCFGPATCSSVRLPTETEWVFRDGRLRLTNIKASSADWNGPRPWEVDDLQVRVGQRVVVASMKADASRLADAVRSADRAALVADKFARWHEPPDRYVIFLAGSAEWRRWYGHEQPDWAAAWAVPVGNFTTEVVVRTDSFRASTLQSLLSHELTHVTSLAGDRDGGSRTSWWLMEGIADYAQFLDRPVRQYDALAPTREFVHGSWDGAVAVDPPDSDASVDEAAAHYGVAFLAVRRIADKYGQDKMINFFGAVVHDGQTLDAAARSTLGLPWSTVQADCASFVRSSVG